MIGNKKAFALAAKVAEHLAIKREGDRVGTPNDSRGFYYSLGADRAADEIGCLSAEDAGFYIPEGN